MKKKDVLLVTTVAMGIFLMIPLKFLGTMAVIHLFGSGPDLGLARSAWSKLSEYLVFVSGESFFPAFLPAILVGLLQPTAYQRVGLSLGVVGGSIVFWLLPGLSWFGFHMNYSIADLFVAYVFQVVGTGSVSLAGAGLSAELRKNGLSRRILIHTGVAILSFGVACVTTPIVLFHS